MEQVQLRVNAINQLILFRNSTFKDPMCFVDENVQNAQRAGAKSLYVTYNENEKLVTFINDGDSLTDPQALFSIAESGWGEQVKTTENPFGMGFFSNVTVSSLIIIQSGKFKITFDVDYVIAQKDTTAIKIEELEEEVPGFQMFLHNFDFKTSAGYKLKERLQHLGKYVHDLDIYNMGKLCDKIELLGDGTKDTIIINDGELKGWFKFTDNWVAKLGVYYKGRFVTNLDFYGLVGDVHITDGILNLTMPDRKDVIKDEKYSNFIAILELYIKEACVDLVLNGDQASVDRISQTLKYYAKGEEVFRSMKFMVVYGTSDYDFVRKMIKIKKERSYVNTFSELEAYLKREECAVEEMERGYVEVVSDAGSIPYSDGKFDAKPASYSGGHSYEAKPAPTLEKVYGDGVQEIDGQSLLESPTVKFWIDIDDLSEFEEQVNVANYYNVDLIVCKNKIESSLWKEKEYEGKVFHISKINDKVVLRSEVFNLDLNVREQRATMLFAMLSRMAGFDHNVFVIGDVVATRVLELPDLENTDEMKVPDVKFVANKEMNKVYIDRNIVKSSKLRSDLSTIIALNDYKFMMKHIHEISEALGMLMGKNETSLMVDLIRALADNPWY